ncbi:hypothetical protein TELCIR_17160 [Teladorsagia circumcincta]|uniref:Uncharacterized protein n=1 Tax=Teladorsagia circumcincta TaxID=45464 RepID=A0A2G9TTU3_TELCI|nr:hypothetical protein TELCIR_17160 [Teladorsagia circumcincta]
MKFLILAFCFYLSRWATQAEAPGASKAEQIPLEAQALSGLQLVEYLRKNQDLFEVGEAPVRDFKYKLMDLRFMKQNRPPVVEDVENDDDDIPKRECSKLVEAPADCAMLSRARESFECAQCVRIPTY